MVDAEARCVVLQWTWRKAFLIMRFDDDAGADDINNDRKANHETRIPLEVRPWLKLTDDAMD